MQKPSNNKEQNSSSDEEVTNKLQYTKKGMNIESKTSNIVSGTDGKIAQIWSVLTVTNRDIMPHNVISLQLRLR